MSMIRFTEGTTGTAVITLPDSVDLVTLVPTMQVRAKLTEQLHFTFGVGSGLTIADGKIFLRVLPTLTQGKPGNYKWQIRLKGTQDEYVTQIGDFIIDKAVAK